MDSKLAAELQAFQAKMERERLRVFRTDLGRRVCLASPLLLDACRSGELDEAAWRLRPTRSWPERIISKTLIRGIIARGGYRGLLRMRAYDLATDRLVGAQDQLMLRITTRSAHITLCERGVVIRTTDRGGRLILPGMLSLAERDGLVGEPVDRAFQHPIVNHRPYIVAAAEQDVNHIQTLIDFVAAPIEWRLPWARPWELYQAPR